MGRAGGADDTRLWRLANVSEARLTGETFERDPEFDLQSYAERSFGVFQEPPVEVALRFDAGVARDAATFLFHPNQIVFANPDGSLTVSFRAGGLDEMCWHLFTWGRASRWEKPARLRRRLARMCASLAGAPRQPGTRSRLNEHPWIHGRGRDMRNARANPFPSVMENDLFRVRRILDSDRRIQ